MTARLTLVNETAWSTKDLRRWIARGLAALGARPDKVVTCVYRRRGTRRLGYAEIRSVGYLEARRIRLYLPRPVGPGDAWDEDTCRLYARTLAHEVDHNLGLEHPEMGGCHVDAVDESRIGWATDVGVHAAPARTAPGALCRAMVGLDKAEAALARWTRKQALAKTKVAKYRRAVARWTRRLEAAKQAEPVRAEEA